MLVTSYVRTNKCISLVELQLVPYCHIHIRTIYVLAFCIFPLTYAHNLFVTLFVANKVLHMYVLHLCDPLYNT